MSGASGPTGPHPPQPQRPRPRQPRPPHPQRSPLPAPAAPTPIAAPAIAVDYARFLDCVHCGLCLEACPTYLELGLEADSPRGRIHLMRGVADGDLALAGPVARHLDLCLGCRACETACPSGVRYGTLIEAARAAVERTERRPPKARFLRRIVIGRILPYPRRLAVALAPVRALDALGLRELAARLLPPAAARLLRLVPAARRRGDLALAARPVAAPPPPPLPPGAAAVGLLRGCATPLLYPGLDAATRRVLAAAGFEVAAEARGCCGALHLHGGDPARAQVEARRTVAALDGGAAGGGPGGVEVLAAVVTNAAGCGATMREYGDLLAGDPAHRARARVVAARVRDVAEVLDEAAAAGRLALGPVPLTATYHDPCHLAHAQGVREAPRRLLGRIPELRLVPLPESDVCCGAAGTYNLTEPEMAARLLARKVARIAATGAAAVVTGNPGCMMQIAAGLGCRSIEVLHTVEIVDRALRSRMGATE